MISRDGDEYTIDFSRTIGSGAFGCVHPGRTRSGRNVAVKRARDEKEIRLAQKEVEFYRRCAGARNIVQYVGSEHKRATDHSPERFSFAMERALFSLDKLMKHIRNLQGLAKEIIIDLICDSVFALLTLKDRGIAHRDIKHLNILVFPGPKKGRRSQYLFKFCDMGVSSFVSEGGAMQTLVGTPNALCPPLALAHAQRNPRSRDHYTREQCDLWSLGCTLYFVSTGKFPFPVDPKDPNVYAQAVADKCRPEGAIAAERVASDSHRYMYRYKYTIDNAQYPIWFRHCLNKLIAMMFSREPALETLRDMAKSMQESTEKRYISVESMDIFYYCDLSVIPSFRPGYPTLADELSLNKSVEYRLIYENKVAVLSEGFEEVDVSKQPPILFPLLFDIPWAPKHWVFPIKGLSHDGKKCTRSAQSEILPQAGQAICDCEKIIEIVEMSRNILCFQLERVKGQLENLGEKVLMPARFTIYAKMQSFGLLPFLKEAVDKTVMERICEMADRAGKELEKYMDFINNSLETANGCLSDLKKIQLQDEELPGIEDELNEFLAYGGNVEISQYVKDLATLCISRRAYLANQFYNKTNSSIAHTLLQVGRFVLDMTSELVKQRYYVDDCIGIIERPFQEMKNCMERLQANNKLDKLSFQNALQYYKRPEKILDHTLEIRKKTLELLDLVQREGNWLM